MRNPYAKQPPKRQVSRDKAKAKRETLTAQELREVSPQGISSCKGYIAFTGKGETRLTRDHDAENLRHAAEVYIRKDNLPQLFQD